MALGWLDFGSNALWLNGVIFAVAAAMVWWVGFRISIYADSISDRTGLGEALMGLIFLALVTEMPEIGTTVTAASTGNTELALNNIFGGIVMQTAILGVVDLTLVRGALTFFTPRPVLLLEGVLLTMLLALTLAASTAGEFGAIWGVGLWSVLLLVVYILTIYLIASYQEQWQPVDAPEDPYRPGDPGAPESLQARLKEWTLRRLILFFVLGSVLIFIAGMVLARSGEVLAEQTGLGASFVGGTLLAASTSLPELSTSMGAVRLGNYSMAFSNIFGSNGIMVTLLFISDVFYREGPILDTIGNSAMFSAAMGIVVTAVYLGGMVERRDRTIMRMGLDSFLVLLIYPASLVVLYLLR